MQIANHGVLVQCEELCIAIDAVEAGTDYYEKTPVDFYHKILKQKEFQHITSCLFTHSHEDHFSAAKLENILEKKKDIDVIADYLCVKQLKEVYRKNAYILDWKHGIDQKIKINGLSVTAFPCPHLSKERYPLSNYAFLIQIGNFKIFVSGDSDLSDFKKTGYQTKLDNIDAAVVCFTNIFTHKNIKLINEVIHPKQLLVNHFPKDASDSFHTYKSVQKFYLKNKDVLPPTIFLKNYMDSYTF